MKKLIQIALAGLVLSQLQGCVTAVVGGAAATGSAVALDRRTAGVFVSDQEIELRAQSRLSNAFPKNAISATSYNRQVLLTGQIQDEAGRLRAGEVVKGIPDVRTVYNELSVAGPTSLTSDANDTSITSQVKARFVRDEKVPGTKIKVVTETTVVYLMGLVTENEAKLATEIASTTSGVSKVVRLFEILK